MPIYSYACDNCGHEDMVVKPMSQSGSEESCPICKTTMQRDIAADAPHAQSRGRLYANPIHSDSLGIAPSQAAEHRRLFPNIELDSLLRPVFTNYPDHEKYLKATGFHKLPTKIRLHHVAKQRRLQKSVKK